MGRKGCRSRLTQGILRVRSDDCRLVPDCICRRWRTICQRHQHQTLHPLEQNRRNGLTGVSCCIPCLPMLRTHPSRSRGGVATPQSRKDLPPSRIRPRRLRVPGGSVRRTILPGASGFPPETLVFLDSPAEWGFLLQGQSTALGHPWSFQCVNRLGQQSKANTNRLVALDGFFRAAFRLSRTGTPSSSGY